MLYQITKHLNHEWDLTACETKAQHHFWDKFLDEMAEHQFHQEQLTYDEEDELSTLFADYTIPFYGFPIYN